MKGAIEDKLRVLRALDQNPEWADTLKEALEAEKAGIEYHQRYKEEQESKGYEYFGKYLGWEWHEVHTPVPTLNKMVTQKVLDVSYSSRSGTHYMVRNPDIVVDALEKIAEPEEKVREEEMPDDLLDIVIGHSNIKSIVRYAIQSEKPAHLLFRGAPASAKTLFLTELSRLPNSYYCLAQTLTSAGLADILFVYKPSYILIDEIDRLSPDNIGVLNSLMATGIISESKIGKTRMTELGTKVFAAGIRIQRLPKDLLSRFITINFDSYTEKQFIDVCAGILPREGCDVDVARFIATNIWKLYGLDSDVRKAVQIARLSDGDIAKVKEIIKILRNQ